ncbi:hypothetical protein JCM10212_003159 [Sporobolomyces blumeae]
MSTRVYLIGRRADQLLGLATGVLAYQLYERKVGRTVDEDLLSLVRWKWDKWSNARRRAQDDDEAGRATASTLAQSDKEWEDVVNEVRAPLGHGDDDGNKTKTA